MEWDQKCERRIRKQRWKLAVCTNLTVSNECTQKLHEKSRNQQEKANHYVFLFCKRNECRSIDSNSRTFSFTDQFPICVKVNSAEMYDAKFQRKKHTHQWCAPRKNDHTGEMMSNSSSNNWIRLNLPHFFCIIWLNKRMEFAMSITLPDKFLIYSYLPSRTDLPCLCYEHKCQNTCSIQLYEMTWLGWESKGAQQVDSSWSHCSYLFLWLKISFSLLFWLKRKNRWW